MTALRCTWVIVIGTHSSNLGMRRRDADTGTEFGRMRPLTTVLVALIDVTVLYMTRATLDYPPRLLSLSGTLLPTRG
jgi:hypothetical protein